jgi:hypothetical protein
VMNLPFVPQSAEHTCFHEAGHVVAALSIPVQVNLVELIPNGGQFAGRTQLSNAGDHGAFVAAGGFASDAIMYQAGSLHAPDGTPFATENAFIQTMINFTGPDRESFFGSNYVRPNGTWPPRMDYIFMYFANRIVRPLIYKHTEAYTAFAKALYTQKRLDAAAVQTIASKFPPIK